MLCLWQAVDGLLDRQVADVERSLSAALDMRKLNQAAGGLLAGPAGRTAAAPTSKRQVWQLWLVAKLPHVEPVC